MNLPSPNGQMDLDDLLDSLETCIAENLESERLEFKPWEDAKKALHVAAEYVSCMANAVGGWLVFGIADKTIGRTAAIHGVDRLDLDRWQRNLYESVRPPISVQVRLVDIKEGTGKLLVVEIPKGSQPPYGTAQGLFKRRIGTHCMPLDPTAFQAARIESGVVDWSGAPASDFSTEALDPLEIERARALLRAVHPDSEILRLDGKGFLAGLGAVRHGEVTHTGALLFGRPEWLHDRMPQHQLHLVYLPTETTVARNDTFRGPLLQVLAQLEQGFKGPANPEQEITIGLFKLRIPSFPIDVVREALLNAVTHRDYSHPGEVLIRWTASELTVTSPGGFLPGITPRNILRAEPISRNRTLAEALEKLGLVERAGVGRRRIFIPSLSFGKRPPCYETDGQRVTLRIFDGTFDAQMARMVAQWRQEGRDLDLDGLLVLTYLRDHAHIDTKAASEWLQLPPSESLRVLDALANPRQGILERRGHTRSATYHLTKAVAKDLIGKAAYTQARGLDPIRFEEMVRRYVGQHGSITNEECRRLLGLGESRSAKVEASRYLRRWSTSEGFLEREGVPPKTIYRFRQR